MRTPRGPALAALTAVALLAACRSGAELPQRDRGLMSAGETLRFTGTEPFWGGSVSGGTLTYATPENPAGRAIPVRRSEGADTLRLSGSLDGGPFDMTVTVAECSDGMSDRTYPLTATLRLGREVRHGCAWPASRPPQ